MPDPDEPVRQDVLREQLQEGVYGHVHDSVPASLPVHLVVVGDVLVSQAEDPGVGDGHPVGVTSDVLENQSHSLGGRSRIDDPVLCEALFSYRLVNDDTLLPEPPGDQGHEASPELGTHGCHGEQEVAALAALERMPHALAVCPSSRHNAVDVRMVVQIRPPGV